MENTLLHELKERVKELTLLHKTARLLQDERRSSDELIGEIVEAIPAAWQYPEVTCARISFGNLTKISHDFVETQWVQTAKFKIHTGEEGVIQVCYLVEKPDAAEGPFLSEERELIDSVADMLRTYFQHQAKDRELRLAYDNLEQQVRDRTSQLNQMNETLRSEINEHLKARKKIETYQIQLRKLASELSLAEERERKNIASDLHDHLGQALAYIKLKMSEFKGNAIFLGMEGNIDNIIKLVDQSISYTRSLTFEISSPILYELGLSPALEWLTETFMKKYGLHTVFIEGGQQHTLPEEIKVILFKSVRELLLNVVKHANASQTQIGLNWDETNINITVQDNGKGFIYSDDSIIDSDQLGFGLFSIRERLTHFSGSMTVDSSLGKGSSVTLVVPVIYEK